MNLDLLSAGTAGWGLANRLSDEHGGRDDGGPKTFLVADGRLRDVLRPHDLLRQTIDFLILVPARVRIESQSERRREHPGRQLFGVVGGHLLTLAEAMMFGEISVDFPIARDRDADGRRDQAMRLTRRGL